MDLINDDIIDSANRRGAEKKAHYPAVVAARYDHESGRIVISLETGLDLAFSPHHVQGFEKAQPADLDVVEISPSGLGVHFPKIDADFYVPSLIEGFLGSTQAKRVAARENGKLGGRPKKAIPNEKTKAALAELEQGGEKHYSDVNSLIADLRADD